MLNLRDFYYWNSGNLLENRTRGAFAEWIVHQQLGICKEFRVEWADVDVTLPNGTTLEIKSAAYEQVWDQEQPSQIRFDCRQRVSDIYLFSLLEGNKPEDLDSWHWWVVPTSMLPMNQKSIGLKTLRGIAGEPIPTAELKKLLKEN